MIQFAATTGQKPGIGTTGGLKQTEMVSFTNYIGEQGVAASLKIVSLVLFSEQNFGQRADFGNFGLYAGPGPILRCSPEPWKILRNPAREEAPQPVNGQFIKTGNKASELKALSHYFHAFKDMRRGPACAPFRADGARVSAPVSRTRRLLPGSFQPGDAVLPLLLAVSLKERRAVILTPLETRCGSQSRNNEVRMGRII
jgi:hypothetical protein